MPKPIDDILAAKPAARPRIYAYSISDAAHAGLLKVGQTTRDVKQRVAEQLKTAAIDNYRIELDEPAERDDGTIFSDFEVRAALQQKKFESVTGEWVRCSLKDVKTVLTELRTDRRLTGTHHETFAMRREQVEAANKTHAYFHSIWKEDMHAVPRFLWGASMGSPKPEQRDPIAKHLPAIPHVTRRDGGRAGLSPRRAATPTSWHRSCRSCCGCWPWPSPSDDGSAPDPEPRRILLQLAAGVDDFHLLQDVASTIEPRHEELRLAERLTSIDWFTATPPV